MKKRIIAKVLTICLLLSLSPTIYASAALPEFTYTGGGHTYHHSRTERVVWSTNFTNNRLTHTEAGINEENIFSYQPGFNTVPIVVGTDRMFNGGLTLSQAKTRAAERGHDVIGGINASFFRGNMTAVGLYMRDGRIISHVRADITQTLPAIGFRADGSAVIGDPRISITVYTDTDNILVDSVNLTRGPGAIHLYTRDFSANTQTSLSGIHIVMRMDDGELGLGNSISGTVTRVMHGTEAAPIADDEFVISASTQAEIDRLYFLTEGASVNVAVRFINQDWVGVRAAVAGMRFLVRGGEVVSGLPGGRAPRTVAGIRTDGSVILYTVDGRRAGHSNGLSLSEAARRMVNLGCVTAIELDGGGSTTISARRIGTRTSEIANRPSDGSQRRCVNHIILVNTAPPSSGVPALLLPRTETYLAMPNVSVTRPEFFAVDEAYRFAAMPAWEDLAGRLTAQSNNPDVVSASGYHFTTHSAGRATVTYDLEGASGSVEVEVVDRLDSFSVTNAANNQAVREIRTRPGEQIRLAASGLLNSRPVISTGWSFEWQTSGDIGNIESSGLFTATNALDASGHITVTGGGQTATIPVTISAGPQIIEDFSDGLGLLSAGSGGLVANITRDINQVEFGETSAELLYSFGAEHQEQAIGFSAAAPNSGYIWLDISGDGSGHELFVNTSSGGEATRTSLGRLDFTGLRTLAARIPDGTTRIEGFTLRRNQQGSSSGRFFIHQVIFAWDGVPAVSPSINLEGPFVEPGELLYVITAEDSAGRLPREAEITLNGEALLANWEDTRAEIRRPIPEHGTNILTVSVKDDLNRRALAISTEHFGRLGELTDIHDAGDRWFTMYVDFLDERNILDTEEVFGLRYFHGERNATRLEVAKMLTRVLELTPFGEQDLPFADIAGLSTYELSFVRAAFEHGLISGRLSGDGTLNFAPFGEITRAELFTILNRLIPRGFHRSALSEFQDRGQIPTWARPAAETLVGMGIVSGFGGMLNPNAPITRAEVASLIARLFY